MVDKSEKFICAPPFFLEKYAFSVVDKGRSLSVHSFFSREIRVFCRKASPGRIGWEDLTWKHSSRWFHWEDGPLRFDLEDRPGGIDPKGVSRMV